MDKEVRKRREAWIGDHVGFGRQFSSIQALADAVGVNRSTIDNWREGQSVRIETLMKMARTVGQSPVRLLIVSGWLTEDDLAPSEDDEPNIAAGDRALAAV